MFANIAGSYDEAGCSLLIRSNFDEKHKDAKLTSLD